MCGDDQYQCPDTSHCIDRDRLCDLQPDCWCGQDEEDDVCGKSVRYTVRPTTSAVCLLVSLGISVFASLSLTSPYLILRLCVCQSAAMSTSIFTKIFFVILVSGGAGPRCSCPVSKKGFNAHFANLTRGRPLFVVDQSHSSLHVLKEAVIVILRPSVCKLHSPSPPRRFLLPFSPTLVPWTFVASTRT